MLLHNHPFAEVEGSSVVSGTGPGSTHSDRKWQSAGSILGLSEDP